MRWPVLALLALIPCCICVPVLAEAGAPPAPGLTITAIPSVAHIGDTIILNGTVTGINTIAVYLYVTGDGLDPRGVSLENLNIAAGRGLFTTAPVFMNNGTWTYIWDTSIITGELKPGNYTVSVVASPHDRLRAKPQESAEAMIQFEPNSDTEMETPLSPILPVFALAGAAVISAAAVRRRK